MEVWLEIYDLGNLKDSIIFWLKVDDSTWFEIDGNLLLHYGGEYVKRYMDGADYINFEYIGEL